MKIQIEIPDNCRKCICFAEAERQENGVKKNFCICKAFDRILVMNIDVFNRIRSVDRCEECINAEIKED